MRTFLLSITIAFMALQANAQTVSNFDDLSLSKSDTFYVNYTKPGKDVGFTDSLAYFPCVYDTGYGAQFLSYGFVYSNVKDSTHGDYLHSNSSRSASAHSGSNYAVAFVGYSGLTVNLLGTAKGKPVEGFYINNSTYTYAQMKNGNSFSYVKFGNPKKTNDTTKFTPSHGRDWFKLSVFGYSGGTLKADTVSYYLADYRSTDSTKWTMTTTWNWVNLLPLGDVDSLSFVLSSSDTGTYGMNTPAYFCMDDFTPHNSGLSVSNSPSRVAAKVYPMPATNVLNVELIDSTAIQQAVIMDMQGRIIAEQQVNSATTQINTSGLSAGMYILQLKGKDQEATMRFIKQ